MKGSTESGVKNPNRGEQITVAEARRNLFALETKLKDNIEETAQSLEDLGRTRDAAKLRTVLSVDLQSGMPIVFRRGPREVVTV